MLTSLPWNLWIWPYLEIGCLQIQSSEDEAIRVGPNSKWPRSFWERNRHTHTGTQRESAMWQQKQRLMYWSCNAINAENWQPPAEATKRQWPGPPWSFCIDHGPPDTLTWTSSPQSCETMNFCSFKSTSFWYFVKTALGIHIPTKLHTLRVAHLKGPRVQRNCLIPPKFSWHLTNFWKTEEHPRQI